MEMNIPKFGDNIIVRNVEHAFKAINQTISNYQINNEFVLGISAGLVSSFSYNKYFSTVVGRISPPPVAAIADVAQQAASAISENTNKHSNFVIKNYDLAGVMPALALALFRDDHFLAGTIIGIGVAAIIPHPLFGIPAMALGVSYELYLDDKLQDYYEPIIENCQLIIEYSTDRLGIITEYFKDIG